MQAVDPVIPVSVLVSRLEGHRKELRDHLASLPWWRFQARQRLLGAIATYQVEIDAVLELGGKSQPVWNHLER